MIKLTMLIVLGSPLQDEPTLKSSWAQVLQAWRDIEKYRPEVGRAGLDDTFLRTTVLLHDALKSAGLNAEKGEYSHRALKCFLTLCLGQALLLPEGLGPVDELEGVDSTTDPDASSVPLRALLNAIHRSRKLRPIDPQEKLEYDRLMKTASRAMKTLRIASADTPPVLQARALALIRATVLGHPYPEHVKSDDDHLARVRGLISELGRDEIAARDAAMKALAAAGDGALPQIREALDSQDGEVRARARTLLGFSHEPWTAGGRQEGRWHNLEGQIELELELPKDK